MQRVNRVSTPKVCKRCTLPYIRCDDASNLITLIAHASASADSLGPNLLGLRAGTEQAAAHSFRQIVPNALTVAFRITASPENARGCGA